MRVLLYFTQHITELFSIFRSHIVFFDGLILVQFMPCYHNFYRINQRETLRPTFPGARKSACFNMAGSSGGDGERTPEEAHLRRRGEIIVAISAGNVKYENCTSET